MYDLNECIRSLNVGLPDDIARLKAAGYYKEAIARIDRLLAEDWTKTQNGPASTGIAPPEGYVPPENPTPHGVDALREALTVQKEIMRRLPGEYCWTEAEAIARMQERVKGFTAEEFRALDWEGRMDWRFVEGEKRYQARFAETLLATHADLAARKLTPDAPNNKNEERHRLHEKMEREGSASADITLRTSIRMSDDAFAAALPHCPMPVCYNGDLVSERGIQESIDRYPSLSALMLGRGLLGDPSLVTRVRGGERAGSARLQAFHDTLFTRYCDAFGDSRIAVLRMKELWFYFGNLFENSEKLQKSIKKAKNAEEFERAAAALFCSCEVRGNAVPAWFRPA